MSSAAKSLPPLVSKEEAVSAAPASGDTFFHGLNAASLVAALKQLAPHIGALPEPKAQAQIDAFPGVKIAVILPCYNESKTISDVIDGFRASLPQARIAVFDNNSSDNTAEIARIAGADVFCETRRGKGNVVRRMFADIDADVYLMADGDGTYDAASAPKLISMIVNDRMDMAIGARENVHENAHRAGHAFGNKLFNTIYGTLFGSDFGDIFSGYRAFSRRFVKSFPALSSGFEIETELSVHASQLKLPTGEIVLPYGKRPEGSSSKLSTFRDGWRILKTMGFLLKETRPALFFGAMSGVIACAAVLLAVPLVVTYLETGLVPRLPTAVLCTGLMLIAGLTGTCGMILDSLARSRVEQKRMLYLAINNRTL